MPRISWDRLPLAIRRHLIDRMHDRKISLAAINALRLWIDADPDLPDGPWFKDFGSFKLCGEGGLPKTFLLRGQVAKGAAV